MKKELYEIADSIKDTIKSLSRDKKARVFLDICNLIDNISQQKVGNVSKEIKELEDHFRRLSYHSNH